MPTPDPSLLPAAVSTVAGVFTSNYTNLLLASIALIGIVTVPIIVIKGGFHWALSGLRSLFAKK